MKMQKIKELIEELDRLLKTLEKQEDKHHRISQKLSPVHRKGWRNMLHYKTLRSQDIRPLQKKLGYLGISRFGNAEAHIRSSILQSKRLLEGFNPKGLKPNHHLERSIRESKELLKQNTQLLFGPSDQKRRVRVMVTLGPQAIQSYPYVEDLVRKGMDCARINCAHDEEKDWLRMIDHIRQAEEVTGKKVRIAMDLAGPKIRTGSIQPGPEVIKVGVQKNQKGEVIEKARVTLVKGSLETIPPGVLPVESTAPLGQIPAGTLFRVRDARGKKRTWVVRDVHSDRLVVEVSKNTYIESGSELRSKEASVSLRIGKLPAQEIGVQLVQGDYFHLTGPDQIGRNAVLDEDGKTLVHAQLNCQYPGILKNTRVGERVVFDDGKLEALIREKREDCLVLEVIRAREKGIKIRAEKGIAFPDTTHSHWGLTEKDRQDLPFVVRHADMVNASFINSPKDVRVLREAIDAFDLHRPLAMVLKIETKTAYDLLFEILTEAMGLPSVGVMIARGDLAVETGWASIGRVQEEIVSLCAAGRIPVIWATQVLENHAKTGVPSRSEITDAVMGLKAECVMLNKGPFLLETLDFLNGLLTEMEEMHEKRERMLPAWKKSSPQRSKS